MSSQLSSASSSRSSHLLSWGVLLAASALMAAAAWATPAERAAPAVVDDTKVAQRKVKVFETFPTVDLRGLGEAEKMAFSQIVNDEICPCSCPKSFAACLQKDTKCQPAVILANWIADELRRGTPGEMLAEQVTNEIASGYGAKKKTIATAGYATKGAKKPRYQLVEFADFECGHCRAASAMVDRLVKEKKDLQVVFKHFPLSFHAMATPAAVAAEAAGEQGKFWEMHDALFATQNMLDENLISGHAKALGLDARRFEQDIKSPHLAAKVQASRQEGEALGVQSTPSFYINGRPFNLMRTPQAFAARFAMEDARATARCE